MQEVFIPELAESYRWLSITLIIGIAGGIIAYAAFKKKEFPIRPVSQLLGMFGCLIGLLGAAFIGWNLQRTPTLVVNDDFINIGNAVIKQSEIEKTYIEVVSDFNLMGEPTTRDVAVLQLRDGSLKLFSEDIYEIEKLVEAIRKMKAQ